MNSISPDIIPIALREGRRDDMNFVFDTWLNSFRDGSREMGHEMRTGDYFRLQRERIQRILAAGGVIIIAHPEPTPSVISAWACLDVAPSVFHYVYTRNDYGDRKRGYAKLLVGARQICTHLTDSRRPDSFAAWKHRAGFRYMPHLLEGL